MTPTEQQSLLADVEAFCQEVRPGEELCYLEHRHNEEALTLARKYNLMGMAMPKEYGGRGADLRTYARALARIGREGTGLRTLFSGHISIGQTPILEWGNEAQKQKYLPPSCRGETLMAFGLTEPDAGSNPLEMQMTYRREGNKFLLNGVKYLISNGGLADVIVTFAYPEDKRDRVSAFIVETKGPGFEAEDLTAKLGLPTSNTAMFELSDYEVPAENLLGDEGNGFRIAMTTLISGRLSVSAGCLGVIEDCLAESLNYATERHQHGKPIAKHQLVQEHIAQIEIARQATDSLLMTAVDAKAASRANPGDVELHKQADMLAAQAKFFASNAAFESADRAVQIFGGGGSSEP